MNAVIKPQTVIRKMVIGDAVEVMKMCHELHEQSSMAHLSFSEEKIRKLFINALTFPRECVCFVAEHDGELIGTFYGKIVPYYFNYENMAQEYWVYVREPYRGTHAGTSFIKRFYAWAAENCASEVQIAPSVGIQTKRTEQWLNNIGYETTGVMTKRRVG